MVRLAPDNVPSVDRRSDQGNASHATRDDGQMTRRLDLPDAEIVAQYDAGEPVVSIAQHHGVSTPVIYTRLREHGRSLRLPRTTPAQCEAALALYRTGLSPAAVAARLGISRTTVRKVVDEAGAKRTTAVELPWGHLGSAEVQEIVQRRRTGESVRSLGIEYGIPRSTLARRLARAQDRSPGHA